jgi:protein disulfide-isomerase-like protein
LSAFLGTLVLGDDGDLESAVAVITDNNIEQVLEDSAKQPWLLEFYAPWCSHCKALAPVYEEAAGVVKGLRFAKVDATRYKPMAVKYGVHGYPTLKWLRDGHMRPYRGPQSVAGFQTLAQKLYSHPVTELNSLEEYDKFKSDNPLWYLLGYSNPGDSDTATIMDTFKTVSRRFQDELTFGVTMSKEVLAQYKKGSKVAEQGVKKPFIVKVNGTEAPIFINTSVAALVELEKEKRVDTVGKWVQDQKFPLVTDLTGRTFYSASHGGRLLCAAIYATQEDKEAFRAGFERMARSAVAKPADAVEVHFYFGVMDGTEDKVDEFLKNYGVDTKLGLPSVVVFDMNTRGSEKYFNEGVSQLRDVPAFLEGILDGSVTPQVEGFWGLPDKYWRSMKAVVPSLSKLDFLPQYSLVAPIPIIMLYFFIKVLCMEDDEDDGYYYDKEQDRYLPKSERPTRSEEEKEKNQKKAD